MSHYVDSCRWAKYCDRCICMCVCLFVCLLAYLNKRLSSPRDPHDALCQLKCCPTVVQITHTVPPCRPEVHLQHLPFYFATCIVTRIVAVGSTIAQRACDAVRAINKLSYNQPCWCQLDRVIIKLRLPPKLLTTPRIPPPAHRRGRGHRGGWTQIFGGEASKPEISQISTSRKTQFVPTQSAFGAPIVICVYFGP